MDDLMRMRTESRICKQRNTCVVVCEVDTQIIYCSFTMNQDSDNPNNDKKSKDHSFSSDLSLEKM